MPSRRIARLNEQLRADVSELIAREMKDPRLAGLISITGVELSPDLRHAQVYVSVLGTAAERQHTLAALRRAAGFLRTQLATRLTTKRTPDLHFVLDASIERGERIMDLIRQVEHERARPPSDEATGAEPTDEHP